jgi:serine phosphatase RsbU (regulator of sigma subunit)
MKTSTFTVGEGDRLVFYTDGLLEARDRAGRYFRLEDCADTLRGPDLEAAADGLLDRLVAHTGRRLDDDVAVLLFEAASAPAGVPGEPQGPAVTAHEVRPDDDLVAAAG